MRVLIVGGGHASLPLIAEARGLVRDGHRVTLVSDCARLWYSGMTPEYLGGVYTRDDITIDLARICEREGVRFVPEAAVALDPASREVEVVSGARIPYDVCALDVGAANPAADRAGGAVRTKPLHRIAALAAFLGEVSAGNERRTLAIVGGGAAVVEVALNLSARPDLDALLAITLVEPGEALLGRLASRAQSWAVRTLRGRGVDVRLGAEVARVEDGRVELADGGALRADRVLWATGSVGHDWLAASLRADARGFVHVRQTLQARDHPRVFVAGDAALVDGHEDLARIGVHAVKQGPTLAENVRALVGAMSRGEAPGSVSLARWRPYPASPLILSTGAREGLFAVGPVALRGAWALALKHRVDRKWIEGYLGTAPSWSGHVDLRAATDGPVRSASGPRAEQG